jgi:hypothetical protein
MSRTTDSPDFLFAHSPMLHPPWPTPYGAVAAAGGAAVTPHIQPINYNQATAFSHHASNQAESDKLTAVLTPQSRGPIATMLESKRAAAAQPRTGVAAVAPVAAPSSAPTVATASKFDHAVPRMSSNLERQVHVALSIIFTDKEFEKIRPSWLRNPRTGRLCELDFYNHELKLAIECQGIQHYVYPNNWHKSRAEWEEQLYRDRLKLDLCQQAGVTLLHVPYTVQLNKMEQYLREEIRRVTPVGSTFHTWLMQNS